MWIHHNFESISPNDPMFRYDHKVQFTQETKCCQSWVFVLKISDFGKISVCKRFFNFFKHKLKATIISSQMIVFVLVWENFMIKVYMVFYLSIYSFRCGDAVFFWFYQKRLSVECCRYIILKLVYRCIQLNIYYRNVCTCVKLRRYHHAPRFFHRIVYPQFNETK